MYIAQILPDIALYARGLEILRVAAPSEQSIGSMIDRS